MIQHKLVDPQLATVNPTNGQMDACTGHYKKRLSQVEGIYADQAAFKRLLETKGDIVTYEVYEFMKSEEAGDMIFGTSIVCPGKVGDEYFMTRGHSHARADRSELYFCISGRGLMLMEAPDGKTRTVNMTPMGIVYVPPFWKHRTVNTGDAKIMSIFAYPADAGHEYGTIEQYGMRKLVVDVNGQPELIDNPRFRS